VTLLRRVAGVTRRQSLATTALNGARETQVAILPHRCI
jgi:hypothetical protein